MYSLKCYLYCSFFSMTICLYDLIYFDLNRSSSKCQIRPKVRPSYMYINDKWENKLMPATRDCGVYSNLCRFTHGSWYFDSIRFFAHRVVNYMFARSRSRSGHWFEVLHCFVVIIQFFIFFFIFHLRLIDLIYQILIDSFFYSFIFFSFIYKKFHSACTRDSKSDGQK